TQKTAEGFNLEKLFSDMPTEFTDIISRYDASLDLLSDKFGSISSAASDTVNELAGNITSKVTHTISDILGFATLFIGSLIVLSVVVWLIGLILKLPVLSGIDKALGFLFGIITGVLLVWVYSNLLNYGIEVLCAVKPGILSENVIENTFIIKYISDNFPFGFAA
ncbi:MAG: CvpA family protein, partial [Clostridia bacterium]|nr:CvpA family protein [Clostridia bacterium]